MYAQTGAGRFTWRVAGAVIVFRDVSQSRAVALQLAHSAQHDFLTDRHKKQVALLFLDLDNFKHVNDSLRHAIGDQLLQSVAARLVAGVCGSDSVFRQGGDEFIILLAEIEHPQDAALVAETLRTAVIFR